MRSDFRLAAFDMDGTLLVEKSSWRKIHDHFGTTDVADEALQMYTRGEIDYMEFMRRDIGVWPKPLHISQIEAILSHYTLRDGAKSVVQQLKAGGIKTAIITAGLDILANKVGKDLGVDYVVANALVTDERGYLTGEGIMRVDASRKHLALASLTSSLDITLKQCIAVGDTLYDRLFLREAGLGFVLGDARVANETGVRLLNDLREILDLI